MSYFHISIIFMYFNCFLQGYFGFICCGIERITLINNSKNILPIASIYYVSKATIDFDIINSCNIRFVIYLIVSYRLTI